VPRLRLIGLILFVTTIFVGMIAVATQTKEIRFTLPEGQRPLIGQPDREPSAADPRLPDLRLSHSGPPALGDNAQVERPEVEFFRIPIAWPLALSGGAGLFLWFAPAPRRPSEAARRRRRSRK